MGRRYDDSFQIPSFIITDCVCRFFMANNKRILEDPIWFGSFFELAYWFYKDQYVDERPKELKNVSFQCFVQQATQILDLPIPGGRSVAAVCAEFIDHKHRVNTYGGILVNPDLNKVLLVQSFNGQSWSFPKGKIEENEAPVLCAIREVKEEVNYDMTVCINPDDNISRTVLEQVTVLYIIYGVPEDTPFKTNTTKEIGDIKWFDVNTLPVHKKDKRSLQGTDLTSNNFFVTIPFVKGIRDHLAMVRQRCIETFGSPVYHQRTCQMDYLKKYHRKIFLACMQHVEETEQEREERERREEAAKRSNPRTFQTDNMVQKAPIPIREDQLITRDEIPSILEMLQKATTRSDALQLSVDRAPALFAAIKNSGTNNSAEHTKFTFKSRSNVTASATPPSNQPGNGYSDIAATAFTPTPSSSSNVCDAGPQRQRRVSSGDNASGNVSKGGGAANTMIFTNSNSSIANNISASVSNSNNKVQRSNSGRSKNRRSKRHSSGGRNKPNNIGDDVPGQVVPSAGRVAAAIQATAPVSTTSTSSPGAKRATANSTGGHSSSKNFMSPSSGIVKCLTWETCQLNVDDIMAVVEQTWVQQGVATTHKRPTQPRQPKGKENQTRQ